MEKQKVKLINLIILVNYQNKILSLEDFISTNVIKKVHHNYKIKGIQTVIKTNTRAVKQKEISSPNNKKNPRGSIVSSKK